MSELIVKRNDKDWYKDLIIYQVYPMSFMDGNNDGIGDLRGIISKLPYLKELGINAIWLSPIYRSPFVDNGYDISDYRDIDPRFGTMDDFDEYVNECHKLGIYVIMDLVVNHTSDKHPWFVASSASRDNEFSDYYIWRDEPNNWAGAFGGSAWEYSEKRGQYYLHTFSKGQPDLNWKNERVQHEVLDMISWWCGKGVDGFRVDAISYLDKADFDYSPNPVDVSGYAFALDINSNRPGTHRLISMLRTQGFDKFNAMSVGEVCCYTPEDNYNYSSDSRKEFNMAIPFVPPVLEIETWSPLNMKKQIKESYEVLKEDGWWARFLSNHDKPRQVSLYGDDKNYRELSAKFLATITELLPGTPFIFQGEEIGMTNVYYDSIDDYNDIDMKNMYELERMKGKSDEDAFRFAQSISRDNARSPMQWNDSINGGFSLTRPWLNSNPNYKEINVEKEEKSSDSILSYYKELIALRRNSYTLRRGLFEFMDFDSPYLFSYKRYTKDDEYLILGNFSKDKVIAEYDINGYKPVLKNYNKNYSKKIASMEPYEVVVLERM